MIFQTVCLICFAAVVQLLCRVRLFATPQTAAHQAPLSSTVSWSLLKFTSTELVMLSNHLILCCLLLLPSIFPKIRVFFNESALCIRWPKFWSLSFSISPSNEYLGLVSFRIRLVGSPCCPGVCSSTIAWKHLFFGTQPSLWSNSHIHTWLPENPVLTIWTLLAKWCLCFLIC